MRRLLPSVLVALVLAGCGDAVGDAGTTSTFREDDVPFTFEVPAAFADGDVDHGNTRGDVLGVRALDKVNLLGVRHVAPGSPAPGGRDRRIGDLTVRVTNVVHRVLGHDASSRLAFFDLAGQRWELECQSTPDRRARVLKACERALTTLAPRR